MKINPTSINPIIFHPIFRSYSVKRSGEDYEYYTSTTMFRNDLDWSAFALFLKEKYKNAENINLICHACSDGEEAYSLALKLRTFFGNKADKFFPITAKDFDPINIRLGKRGEYDITNLEMHKIEENCGFGVYKYIDIDEDFDERKTLKIKDNLKYDVDFTYGNILKDADDIDPENTVLMCRNFWMYLPPHSQVELAKKLARNMNSSSLIVIGKSDKNIGIDRLLESVGFEETKIECVMQKKK